MSIEITSRLSKLASSNNRRQSEGGPEGGTAEERVRQVHEPGLSSTARTDPSPPVSPPPLRFRHCPHRPVPKRSGLSGEAWHSGCHSPLLTQKALSQVYLPSLPQKWASQGFPVSSASSLLTCLCLKRRLFLIQQSMKTHRIGVYSHYNHSASKNG